jgi:hypothetical protein
MAMVMLATGKWGVVYLVHTEELKRRELGQPVQFTLLGRLRRKGTVVELFSAQLKVSL